MLSEEKINEAIATTKNWVERIIVGLNLCPFAKSPFQQGNIRFTLSDNSTMLAFLEDFIAEIDFLDKNPTTETTLIIIPALGDMKHFKMYINFCEETIRINDWNGYQLVFFHPYMRFDKIPAESPRNLTAMAPYPTLHILRTASVENLGASLKKDVQTENDKKLKKMTANEVAKLWDGMAF